MLAPLLQRSSFFPVLFVSTLKRSGRLPLQHAFQPKAVQEKVREVIEATLKGKEYNEAMVPQWINDICESCVEELFQPRKPFKYVVTCAIMQRTGAAIHSSTACYWDARSDGTVAFVRFLPLVVHVSYSMNIPSFDSTDTIFVCWPKRNSRDTTNRTIICVVTVFAVSFVTSV